MPEGTLYLVPSPLGDTNPLLVMPAAALNTILKADYFIVESVRTARRLIASIPGHKTIAELHFQEMGKHADIDSAIKFLEHAANGNDIVLLSEAGSPCVADPGGIVVAAAHRMKLNVKPLAGPSSIIQALMASGFNGQQFTFAGYLPIDAGQRKDAIRRAEKLLLATGQTQIFIETPFRNNQIIDSLVETCQPSTMLCIASGIGSEEEKIVSRPLSWWKANKPPIGKVPAVFLLGKSLLAD
ncbi:MAG: SAM-dependent methyltransferase [Bacteroidia bacterium]|nr:SAM-dependent methyltransferase [Bacteroidia bacterium]